MITQIKKTILAFCLTLPIVCLVGVLPALAATILPEGLVMENTYSPGRGRPVGIVQQVLGDAIVMHDGVLKGYKAARGTRLYKGDTVMTLEEGRVRFKLNDGSILSLASESKLKLTQSVYDKNKKTRSSFLQMALGKARFVVVKMLDFKRSEFKVKTPTAVCGVRGSDFILETTLTETTATALADTELEFQSLAFLEEPPVILKDFETSVTRKGERPMRPLRLPQDRIEERKELFIRVVPEAGASTDKDTAGKDETDDDTGVEEAGDLSPEELTSSARTDQKTHPDTWRPDFDPIKEAITEENLAGELPAFPVVPQQ
jgi:hypothetical protein